ncbi:MAG: Monoacylglycerol lipase [Firmicutes bacterium]|nr:Monoacylglycerol lipase [candidate division NPL-UPA2 bacterium]
MRHTEMSWQALDGTRLFAQSWEPENKRGVVCLVHGLGEHSSRYSHFAAVFNQAGFAVVTLDLRGHGKSGGARGHTPSFEHYMDDLQLLLADAEHRFPGTPCFLYGHSMGGLLALNYVLRRQPRLSGVVIASAGLRSALEAQRVKVLAVHLLGSILPQLSQHSGLNSTMLSRDPKVVEQYRNDPLVHDRISLGMAKGCLEAVKYAFAHAAKFSVPLLVMHGAADELTFPSGSAALASLVARDCTLKIWDGLYHELHNEPEKEAVFRYVLTWLEAKGTEAKGTEPFASPHIAAQR